jgi:hypothetical protein
MEDPLTTASGVATTAGLSLTNEARDSMREHLDVPRASGGHRYSFDDLGLSRDAERKRFARYQQRFGVPDEEVR